MMTSTPIPTRQELVRRASDIVPILQKHASWNEQNRRIHEESLQALEQAGIFKLRVPKRYGGYESDTRTLVEVLAEIGQGDGSTAWVAWVLVSNTWLIGLFPDAVQDEVFTTPDVGVSGTLAPTGRAERRDGGFVLNGQWHFQSGLWHSQWSVMAAMSTTPAGGMAPVVALIPTAGREGVDAWDTAGRGGTMKIDEAEFHADRAATLVDTKAASGEAWTLEERARVRMDAAMATRLAKEAIDILNTASGGSSIYSSVPIQRIERDIQAANLQGMMHPNTNLELYGRIRCGLSPNTVNI